MAPFSVLAAGLVAAVLIDVRSRRIPNWLTALMAGAGLVMAAGGVSGLTLGQAGLGLLAGLVLMLPGHALGATGAGDVKLMAAVGAILGPATVFSAFLATAVAGGIFALVVAMRRGRLHATLDGTRRLIASPAEGKLTVEATGKSNRFAYGPAIAVGTLVAVLMR
jgi:prepilin peptidase CpaA